MKDFTRLYTNSSNKTYDEGLRNYMLQVYNFMSAGLAVTGISALMVFMYPPLANLLFNITPMGQVVGNTMIGNIIMISPILIALYFFWGFGNLEIQTSKTLFWVYSALTGLSLSSLGFIYTGESIARTFFICASTFGAMSIYGYSTKRDLTSMGSFMIMGLFGLIISGIINIFLRSTALYFITSILGIIIFIGLIAWDTQRIKSYYYSAGGGERGEKMAILGSFILYLDFINLFLYMLRFFGVMKRD